MTPREQNPMPRATPGEPYPVVPVVRVLRAAGCGNWRRAVSATRAAMEEVGLDGGPEIVLVNGYAEGVKYGFRGSPTVTVDGVDIEPNPPGEPGLAFG